LEAAVKHRSGASCKFAVTGRIESSQLRDVLREDEQDQGKLDGQLNDVTLYVTYSTAPFVRQLPLPEALHSGLKLEFIVSPDDVLADTLMAELRNRGVHPELGDPLALIAEWDTDWGRSMHKIFHPSSLGERDEIHHYSYLGGLNVRRAGESSATQGGDA